MGSLFFLEDLYSATSSASRFSGMTHIAVWQQHNLPQQKKHRSQSGAFSFQSHLLLLVL